MYLNYKTFLIYLSICLLFKFFCTANNIFGDEMNFACDYSSHTVSEKYRVSGEDNKYYHSCKNCGSFGSSTFEAYAEKKNTCTDDGHNAYISCECCEYTDKVVLKLLVPSSEVNGIQKEITEGTNGRAKMRKDKDL